uniref:Uncharacterized protein TCIL3000_11_9590 n=1 Tax=Trypanosoma congolense (strain IL3000) TaxID=1068625 RepID=G0V1H1_TRYCI|nr:unnamed protein product [Trypanosoma congolense IL3000]
MVLLGAEPNHTACHRIHRPQALVHAVEKYVPLELTKHISGMTVYAQLRNGDRCVTGRGSITNGADGSGDVCGNGLNSGLGAIVTKRSRGMLDAGKRDVCVESCVSCVVSSMACDVLKDYYVMWVESSLVLRLQEPLPGKASARSQLHEHNDVATDGSLVSPSGRLKQDCGKKHVVKLLSLHIVHGMAHKDPANYGFVLQSVCQPNNPHQLECYPSHMIRFGLLMHFLWQCPDEAFTAPKVAHREKDAGKSLKSPKSGGIAAPNSAACSFDGGNSHGMMLHLFPSTEVKRSITQTKARAAGPAILIFGLGANVIGNWLDFAFPPDVSIDVVDVEPAVLRTCQQNGQVPPCEEILSASGAPTGVWRVAHDHPRYPHYRFIVGDARDVLLESNGTSGNEKEAPNGINRFYDVIFLDCYDPEKESMLHDAGLLNLCRGRLVDGGALVVNAHIIPRRESYMEQFLNSHFASVQLLPLISCDQCVAVCLNGQQKCAEIPAEEHQKKMATRFGARSARRAAAYIHNIFQSSDGRYIHRPTTCYLDALWLKQARSLPNELCIAHVWDYHE